MLDRWRRDRALARVRSGDGRALRRFRWWQLLTRALFHLRLTGADGRVSTYSVDVPRKHDPGTGDGKTKAHLYLDGRHVAESRLPAAFPVPGGCIEVAVSMFGVKRCHLVTDAGVESQLTPDSASAEGRRSRTAREHPALDRALSVVAVVMLVIGAVLLLLQIAEPVSRIPPIAEAVGTFESFIRLPPWLNIVLGLGALAASFDRALRLRHSWLDEAGN